jgi:hypothetical protein
MDDDPGEARGRKQKEAEGSRRKQKEAEEKAVDWSAAAGANRVCEINEAMSARQ